MKLSFCLHFCVHLQFAGFLYGAMHSSAFVAAYNGIMALYKFRIIIIIIIIITVYYNKNTDNQRHGKTK